MRPASPDDDHFHPVPTADPWWTETSWYSFAVPERNLSGSIYPLFRPNLGICSAGVYVWDGTAVEPWAVPYARTFWHLPLPDGDLTDFTLVNGLRYECVEPMQQYRVSYRDAGEIELDLLYEGLIAPHMVVGESERGHLDQPCRVTGRLCLHGEEIAIDGFAMRDRSLERARRHWVDPRRLLVRRPLQLDMVFTRCRSGWVTRSMCSPDIYSAMGSSPMSCPGGVG